MSGSSSWRRDALLSYKPQNLYISASASQAWWQRDRWTERQMDRKQTNLFLHCQLDFNPHRMWFCPHKACIHQLDLQKSDSSFITTQLQQMLGLTYVAIHICIISLSYMTCATVGWPNLHGHTHMYTIISLSPPSFYAQGGIASQAKLSYLLLSLALPSSPIFIHCWWLNYLPLILFRLLHGSWIFQLTVSTEHGNPSQVNPHYGVYIRLVTSLCFPYGLW